MPEDERKAKLTLSVESKGTTETAKEIAAIGTSTKDLARELKSAGDKNALATSAREAKSEFASLTNEVKNDLTGSLKQAAREADNIRPGSGGGLLNRAGDVGGSASKLTGVANLVGAGDLTSLVGDLGDAAEAAQGLSGALGIGLNPATLAVTAAVVAAGAAFHVVTEGIRADQHNLELQLDAQRSAVEAAFSGATVSDAKNAIDGYNDSIKAQTFLIEDNTKKADAEFAQLVKNKEQSLGIFADLSARLQVAAGLSEVNTYTDNINESKDALAAATAGVQEYQTALDAGLFATDTVTTGEGGLTDARTEAARTIDTAATAERSRAREIMQADRERERAAADMQRQQEQAAQKAEQSAQQAASAQEKYASAIKGATTNYKNAVEDIATKRRTGETDIRVSMGRDLDDIELKNAQDVTQAIKEDWRSAREAAIRDANEINDIRDEGLKASRDRLQEGNFKEAFLAKRDAAERIAQEAKTDQRESAERERSLADRRDDLKTSLREETLARRTAGQRQFEDLKLSTARELEAASITRQRAAALAASARSSELAGLQGHFNRMNGLYQQFFNRVEGMAGQLVASGRGAQPAGQRGIQQQMNAAIGNIVRR